MQCVRHSLGKGRCQLFFTTHFCITILFLHQCWLHSCSLLCSCFFMVYIGPIATHVNSLYIRFKHMATYFSYDYHEYLFMLLHNNTLMFAWTDMFFTRLILASEDKELRRGSVLTLNYLLNLHILMTNMLVRYHACLV